MTNPTPLDLFNNGLAGAAFLGFFAFIIIYARYSNWRATPAGRALMYAIAALNVIVLMASVHLFTGPYPGIQFVRLTAYTGLLFAAWRLVWVLITILRDGKPITLDTFYQPRAKKEKHLE